MDSLLNFGSTHVLLERSKVPDREQDTTQDAANEGAVGLTPPATESTEKAATGYSDISPNLSSGALTYGDTILSVKNVFNVTEHVVDWHGLGLQLELPNSRLKKIQRQYITEDDRRREMIHVWMHSDPEASWEKLSLSLRRIEQRVLAEKISNEVIPLYQRGPPPPIPVNKPWSYVVKGAAPMRSLGAGILEAVQSDAPDYPTPAAPGPPRPPRQRPPRHIHEDRNTNVLMLKLGALSKPCKVHTGDPVVCSNDQCTAILNHNSKVTTEDGGENKVWVCEFCGTTNTIEVELGEIPKEGDILYLQESQRSPKDDMLVSGITKDAVVVFCVDTSGSMAVTTEVPGYKELKNEHLQKLKEIYAGSGVQYMPRQPRNVTYVSRIQCVQAAIDHQLTLLAQNNPSQKVAVVMFGDEVTVTGDGRPENEYIFVGEKLWKESAMLRLVEDIPTPAPIKQTKEHLSERIFSIEEEGQTALGGALLVSVELAKRAPGSKVILCTDGLANRGIGCLDDPKCKESSIAFFEKIGTAAKESSVSVSVVTIKGTECDLIHLGQVASQSGGNVDVVDPMSLTEEFVNILSNSVIAVRVNARIILHSALRFKDGDGKSTLSVPVGNVSDETNLMYEFSSAEGSEVKQESTAKHLQELPFQVQIKYTSLSGQQCLRVFTETRPATSDKKMASQGVNDTILRVHGLQNKGRFLLADSEDVAFCHLSRYSRLSPTLSSRNYLSPAVARDLCPEAGIARPKRRRRGANFESRESQACFHRYASIDDGIQEVCEGTRFQASDAATMSSLPIKLCRKSTTPVVHVHESRNLKTEEGTTYDELAATAFRLQNISVSGIARLNSTHQQAIIETQKCITLSNEGYGFGFLVSPGKEGGTVVQSLVPNGVAWKNGELRKGDKLLSINDDDMENMPHQEVVKKLRELNEEATNSITLCVMREEVRESNSATTQKLPKHIRQRPRSKSESIQSQRDNSVEDARHSGLLSVTLESEEPDGFGLTFRFDDSDQLVIAEIQSDGTADKDGRLRTNDQVLQINGEVTSAKTITEISSMIKDIEDSNGSIELLVKSVKTFSTASGASKEVQEKPHLLKRLSSWLWPKKTSSSSTQDQACVQSANYLMITLHNEGYGFGFTVQEDPKEADQAEKVAIIVSKVFPDGVAHKDGSLKTGDKLVEINGRSVTDMTYREVVTTLRALNEDDESTINLKVVRQSVLQ